MQKSCYKCPVFQGNKIIEVISSFDIDELHTWGYAHALNPSTW